MKLITLIALIIVCFISCRSTKVFKNISGKYIDKGKDYAVILDLQPDSSFTYTTKNMEVTSEAKGEWENNFTDTIYLVRDSVALSEMLSGGYIKDMPDKAFIKNKNAIQMGTNLLKRKE